MVVGCRTHSNPSKVQVSSKNLNKLFVSVENKTCAKNEIFNVNESGMGSQRGLDEVLVLIVEWVGFIGRYM